MFYTKATIESDMAHRIMYSILPTVENGHGKFYDESAASQLIMVASRYLLTGTKVCVDEAMHYRNTDVANQIRDNFRLISGDIQDNRVDSNTANAYISLLNDLSTAFSDKKKGKSANKITLPELQETIRLIFVFCDNTMMLAKNILSTAV